jgi:hypothetical protein
MSSNLHRCSTTRGPFPAYEPAHPHWASDLRGSRHWVFPVRGESAADLSTERSPRAFGRQRPATDQCRVVVAQGVMVALPPVFLEGPPVSVPADLAPRYSQGS